MRIFSAIILIFIVYSQGANCDISERLKDDFFHIYTHTALTVQDVAYEDVTSDKVNYFLFTRASPKEYVKIDPQDPKTLTKLIENKNATIVFIIHGWTGSREADWYEDMKNALLLRQEEFLVVQVDWREPADQIYTVASYNTKNIGKFIGEFIVNLHQNHSIPLAKFLVIGHSLGGHVTGFVGKKVFELTRHKLPRIIALDPAGPLFIARPYDQRLNETDADVVEVLHTDGGTFGYKNSLGTVDFYANGGNFQPGCTRIDILDVSSITEPIMCDHHRAYEFFTEALLNPDEFEAVKCNSWAKYQVGVCEKDQVHLGDLKLDRRGEFYFETNKDKPFSRKRSSLLPVPALSKIF